jgi:hypothetical protein
MKADRKNSLFDPDQIGQQLRRDPPRLGRMYAGRGLWNAGLS